MALILQTALYKRARRIERRLDALSTTARQEALHALRVELKKLRALLRLLRAVSPVFNYKETYALYKPLFQRAGEVREWQLQAAYFEQVPVAPEQFAAAYRAFLERGQRHAMHRWRRLVRDYGAPPAAKVQWLAAGAAGTWTLDALRAYFRGLREQFCQLMAGTPDPEGQALHDVRKIVKEYSVNRRFSVRKLHYDPGNLPGLPADTTAFETTLGEWHDLVIARERLLQDLEAPGWFEQERAHGRLVADYWQLEAGRSFEALTKSYAFA
jgi:CHAD domain-containing protein